VTEAEFDRIYAQVPQEQKQRFWQFRADHPYKEMDIDGPSWRYIACGKGDRTLLFLAGGFLKADMWFFPISTLEDTHRIIAPDAYALQGIFTMDRVCETICQMLDREEVEEATVIGISAGGGVAQILLQEFPERVEHAVLSHTGVVEGGADAEGRTKRILRLVRLMPLPVIRWILKRVTAGTAPTSSKWMAFHDAYMREATAQIDKAMVLRFFQSSLEARRSFAFRTGVMQSWSGQVLVLSSADDENSITSLAKHKTRYPKATTHVFEEGGHHTFMFFPEAYTRVLRMFLESAPGGR
jgi:pimeloyl-ACP methyl ester carboxylesterase